MTDPSSTSSSSESFSILGSAKLNTPDGKNPPTTSTSEATATAQGSGAGAAEGGDGVGKRGNERTECHAAHDELEARLRDEELGYRSKGW